MPFKDLREYIGRLEQEGEVQRIAVEVQPVYEVGAIILHSYDLRAPAPFFLNLRGYPDQRILGAPIGLSRRKDRRFARFAISMGMPPESTALEIIEEYIQRIKKPIRPVMVGDGPCKENIVLGEAVDLRDFPAPLLQMEDLGPCLGNWHANITQDPHTGVNEWKLYRLMTHERKTIVGTFPSAHTMGGHEPVEFAIAIGTEPVTPWVAGTWSTPNVSKADLIGGIRSAPLELVKCETVNLVVPATSEIVIEGFSLPPYSIYHVTAISYRYHPILPVSFTGMSVDDSSVSFSLTKAANILDAVRGHGFPVKAVYCPPEAVSYCTAVSTKIPYPDYARSLANAIWKTDWGRPSGYLFIVEEDVDVTDMGEVLWAVSNTCHPRRGMLRVEKEERSKHLGAYTRSGRNWPREWPKETIPMKASFDNIWPKEVQEKILRDWHAYGYK